MKVLLDECLPAEVRKWFSEHEVHTTKWAGWDGIKNGALLSLAEKQYDAFLTVDRNLMHQNKVSKYAIGVVVVLVKTNRIDDIKPYVGAIKSALNGIQKGQVIVVGETGSKP